MIDDNYVMVEKTQLEMLSQLLKEEQKVYTRSGICPHKDDYCFIDNAGEKHNERLCAVEAAIKFIQYALIGPSQFYKGKCEES